MTDEDVNAALAQGEHPRKRKGVGSIPACGSKSTEWEVIHGRFEHYTIMIGDHAKRVHVPKCPRCGGMKRPHVSYMRRAHQLSDSERKATGYRRGLWTLCNYCKVRWITKW